MTLFHNNTKYAFHTSSQITASSYILEQHLWVNNSIESLNPWSWILAGRWLANKLTVLLRISRNMLTPRLYRHPVNTKHLYDFIQCWTNVEDVGPTLYKCYTNVLCLLGRRTFSQTLYISPMLGQSRRRWPNIKTALGECLVGVVSSLVIRLLNQPHCTVCWRLTPMRVYNVTLSNTFCRCGDRL